jgi:hypothetical protein
VRAEGELVAERLEHATLQCALLREEIKKRKLEARDVM